MGKINELKKIYDDTPIPEELSSVVNKAIADASLEKRQDNIKNSIITEVHRNNNQGENMNEFKNKSKQNRKLFRVLVSSAAALAVLTGSFAVAANASPSFAQSMSGVPILGSLVKVFTGEQVATKDKVANVDIKVPAVEGIEDKAFQKSLNQEISHKMNGVAEDAKKVAAENKKAWLETGGVESEYTPVDIIIDYEVKSISDKTLSFVVYKTETSASAYYENFHYNIDLTTNKEIKLDEALKNQLGEGYVAIASKQITDEIAKRSQEENATYWDGSDGQEGFQTITGKENFYINQNGNVVIEFNKYEIAPGYMGIQDFEIIK
ncbi:MAG: DUF3298 domain-containing protein [Anaerovorax sp.]